MVYLLPFLSYFNWLQKRFRPPVRLPVRPGNDDKYALEATASSNGKSQLNFAKTKRILARDVPQSLANLRVAKII